MKLRGQGRVRHRREPRHRSRRRARARRARASRSGSRRAAATTSASPDALALACDVRDRAQVEALVDATVERFGGLDIVVANAGVGAYGTVRRHAASSTSRR